MVEVAGFRAQGSGFRVQVRVQGSGFRVQGSGFRFQGSGFRVQGSGFRVSISDAWGHLASGAEVVAANAQEVVLRVGLRDRPGVLGLEFLPCSQFKNNHFTEMCCGTEAGSYLRPIDSCITQLKVQGPSRTCNESKEERERTRTGGGSRGWAARSPQSTRTPRPATGSYLRLIDSCITQLKAQGPQQKNRLPVDWGKGRVGGSFFLVTVTEASLR